MTPDLPDLTPRIPTSQANALSWIIGALLFDGIFKLPILVRVRQSSGRMLGRLLIPVKQLQLQEQWIRVLLELIQLPTLLQMLQEILEVL